MNTVNSKRTFKSDQQGLTLVELMISLVISLAIGLAAATAYLTSRSTSNAVSSISQINETAKLTLDMIGREIQMAGFYPAIVPNSAGNATYMGEYINTKNTALAAYNQGVFGCDQGRFNPTSGTCSAATAGQADSIVLNYFSVVELDSTNTFSSGFDCLRQNVANDPTNTILIAAGRPRLVSNRFGLVDTNYSVQGPNNTTRLIATRSLGCNGNGVAVENNTYQPIFEGLADMSFRYGVNDGVNNQSPTRFFTAAQVSALAAAAGKTGWQRVSAVHICIVARTLDNSRTVDAANANKTYEDCRGNVVTYAANDRTTFKRFDRIVAVRNNLNGVY
ncbi:PilW Tfp pilus assembly protein PilW [Comamonadaceae bacterium]